MQSTYVSRPILYRVQWPILCIERDDGLKHFEELGTPDVPIPITEGYIENQGPNMAYAQFGYGCPYISGSFDLIPLSFCLKRPPNSDIYPPCTVKYLSFNYFLWGCKTSCQSISNWDSINAVGRSRSSWDNCQFGRIRLPLPLSHAYTKCSGKVGLPVSCIVLRGSEHLWSMRTYLWLRPLFSGLCTTFEYHFNVEKIVRQSRSLPTYFPSQGYSYINDTVNYGARGVSWWYIWPY